MYNYCNNVVASNPYSQVTPYVAKSNTNGVYNPAANQLKAVDTYKPTLHRATSKENSNAGGIIAGIALGIAALIGVYKGHSKIEQVVKKVDAKKLAYKATHGNMNLKGVANAGKKIGGSILNVGKSVINFPKTIIKETFGLFKKTV